MPRYRKSIEVVNPTDHRDAYSPGIAKLLGHMTIHWASLEFQVQRAVWQLSETHEVGNILTRQLGMNRWLEDLYLLARHRIQDDSIVEKLRKIIENVQKIKEVRNSYVHGLFAMRLEAGLVTNLQWRPAGKKLKRTFARKQQDITTKDLDRLIKNIFGAEAQLASWVMRHIEPLDGQPFLPPLRRSDRIQ